MRIECGCNYHLPDLDLFHHLFLMTFSELDSKLWFLKFKEATIKIGNDFSSKLTVVPHLNRKCTENQVNAATLRMLRRTVHCTAKFLLPSDSYTAVPDFNSMGVGQLASCWKILKQLRLKISKWNITRRLHLITTCNLKISTLGKSNVKYPFKSKIMSEYQIT